MIVSANIFTLICELVCHTHAAVCVWTTVIWYNIIQFKSLYINY